MGMGMESDNLMLNVINVVKFSIVSLIALSSHLISN